MDLRETAGPGALPAILFVSKRHSLRSVLAHGCMEHVGRGRFRVRSCGVPGELASEANPGALAALKAAGMPLPARAPQSWISFVKPSSARTDIVIVLDRFAFTKLPAWPRAPETALWNYPDLVASDPLPPVAEVTRLLHSLRRRLEILAALLVRHAEPSALRSDIRDIGQME